MSALRISRSAILMYIFPANAFISLLDAQTMRIESILHNSIAIKTLHTLAGLGSSVPEADTIIRVMPSLCRTYKPTMYVVIYTV
jgi:hypothetical protein